MVERILNNVQVHPVAWVVICVAALVAAVLDVRKHRIPNPLTLTLCIAGLLWAGMAGGGMAMLEAVAAMALLGLPFLLLYAYAQGGAGDAKLMMAIGPWVGLAGGTLVLACVTSAGLLSAAIYAVVRGQCREVASNVSAIGTSGLLVARRVLRLSDMPRVPQPGPLRRMPYGPAICAGVWIAAGGMMVWQLSM